MRDMALMGKRRRGVARVVAGWRFQGWILLTKVAWGLVFGIWCMPQSLIGFVLSWICWILGGERHGMRQYRCVLTTWPFRSGLSLGRYLFLHKDEVTVVDMKHELGHSEQSLYLGPLYLIAVGVPSVFRWIVCWKTGDWKRYYSGYPENWADRLGQVTKQQRLAMFKQKYKL